MTHTDLLSQAVIMCGISGSGKTRYAKWLEAQGYIRLSTDAFIWEKVGDGLMAITPPERKKLFKECGEEVRQKLADSLLSGQKVVLDATNCRRSVRDEIRSLCSRIGVRPVFIYCSEEKEELWRRLSHRKGEGPDDLIVSYEELEDYWTGFERPQDDETDVYKVSQSTIS